MPTIIAALRAGAKDLGKGAAAIGGGARRTDRDLDLKVALGGAALVLLMMWAMLTFMPIKDANTTWYENLAAALFVIVFGFLFVTVSSRITGLIGTSSNPISGMAIATLMATCAVFLVLHWTGAAFAALAISIGGVVCIASANAGNTSQDLKTGFLVGATPRAQQLALLVGVLVSVFSIGISLIGMNKALEEFHPANVTVDINHLPDGVSRDSQGFTRPSVPLAEGPAGGKTVSHPVQGYILLNAINSPTVADGKYLYNPASGKIEVQWVQGIGSTRAPGPQARLMATVINGILQRKLPWGLILIGVFLVIGVELLGIRSLSFAVGFYISIGTTLIMFCGGMVRWLVEYMGKREIAHQKEPMVNILETEVSPGSLFASGLIAAGGIVGLLGIALKLVESRNWLPENALAHSITQNVAVSNSIAILGFLLLAFSLYHFARKPLEDSSKLQAPSSKQ